MNARVPAEVFAPGEFLREELEARGWTQIELGEILGRPPRVVNEIISGKRAITPETAKGLAAAFGTSAQYWMNLETSYQLSKTRIEEDAVSRRSKLYGMFPVKEIIKRGWVEASESLDVLEKRFCDFFDIEHLDSQPRFAHAAKKSGKFELAWSQWAWLARARQIALATNAAQYSDSALKSAILELQKLLPHPESARYAAPILANAGVRLVIVEQLPGAKMDGSCFWLNNSSPVIALSLRFDRIDNFWHTLFHEIDHILHGEGKQSPIIEALDESDPDWADDPIEQRANKAGAAYCINSAEFEGFIARVNPMFSLEKIVGFARRISVHPGIVVGQLQNRKLIPYSFHRKILVPVKVHIIDSIITDGFGRKLPL